MQSILLVSYYAPSRGHAGGLRLLDLYAQIKQIKPDIYLTLLTCRHSESDWGLERINDIFDKVHWLSYDAFNTANIEIQQTLSGHYDLIDLQYHQSGVLFKIIQKTCPGTKIIFSPMESQVRAFQLAMKKHFKGFSIKFIIGLFISAIQELYYCSQANHIACVSSADLNFLKIFTAKKKLYLIETGVCLTEFPTTTSPKGFVNTDIVTNSKKKLVFLAYFRSKTNREALCWFCKYVHPLIRAQVKNYELMVVGRGLDELLIHECANNAINWVGEVECLSSILLSATAGIAPALSGAGVRGKIHQYAAFCLPCVASTIAAESLKYQHGQNIFLADAPTDFAGYCITLLTDKKMAEDMGKRAHELCLVEYSWASMLADIKKLYFI